MNSRTLGIVGLLVLLLMSGGCTCLIRNPLNFLANTNHTYVDEPTAEVDARQILIQAKIEDIDSFKRRPVSIANTEDCEVRYRVQARVTDRIRGDSTHETVQLRFRASGWLGAWDWDKAPGIYDLEIGHHIEIAYNPGLLGRPRSMIVYPSKQRNE